jgi:Ca2+/Na+ antiporter
VVNAAPKKPVVKSVANLKEKWVYHNMRVLIIILFIIASWLIWLFTGHSVVSAILVWAWWLLCYVIYKVVKTKLNKAED